MPRPRRIEIEGGIYHLYNRFIDGQSFFKNAEIVKEFRKIFYEAAEYCGVGILAWDCMPNHLHSMIILSEPQLSAFIQRYSTKFARFVNKKLNRKGHVFQERHKTQLVDTEKYLLTLLAYIFLNPVRAGIVDNIGDYKWSNYNEIINENNNPIYNIIYGEFSKDREEGRKAFKNWIENINKEDLENKIVKTVHDQFLMDNVKRSEVLKKIDRRSKHKDIEQEKRKKELSGRKYSVKEINEILNNIEDKSDQWKTVWRSKEKFLLHFKWYLLRYYGKLTLEQIRIIEKKSRHTIISEALRDIEKSKKKKQIINEEIKRIIKEKKL